MKFLYAVFVALMLSTSAHAASLQVAAAADLAVCIKEINENFAKTVDGADVKFSIGASGNFFAQIKNGAPYDVFLSADSYYPQELIKAGLADGSTLMTYAIGQLVIWSADPKLDLSKGMNGLNAPEIQRIAIANPELAPYGRAAKAALEKAGLWDSLKPKFVFGENIAQTAQFIKSGNAQLGFVGNAHASKEGKQANIYIVPANLYPTLEQSGVVTLKGKDNPLSKQYLLYLKSDAGRAILHKYGFVLPQ